MRLRIAPDSNRVMWLLHYAGEDLHPRLVPSDFMIGTKHDSHAHTGEKMPELAGLMRGGVGMAWMPARQAVVKRRQRRHRWRIA